LIRAAATPARRERASAQRSITIFGQHLVAWGSARTQRATDPDWTERRLVPLAPRTLKRLGTITEGIKTRIGVNIEPMQLAGLLLEKTADQLSEDEVNDLA
jgi:hypothetical protein